MQITADPGQPGRGLARSAGYGVQAYRHYLNETDFPVADDIMKHGFLVGAHHGLNSEDVDRVVDLLIKFDQSQKA